MVGWETQRIPQTQPVRAEQQRLLDRHAEAAVRLAYHITRNAEAAQDLSQEAFVKALERLPELRDPDAFKSWFNRILVNLCRDWLRTRGVEQRGLKTLRSVPPRESAREPGWRVEQAEELAQLREALLELPLEFREVVALVCVEGLTPRETAGILNEPEGTVRWRLHEGRKRLRAALE